MKPAMIMGLCWIDFSMPDQPSMFISIDQKGKMEVAYSFDMKRPSRTQHV